MPYDTTSCNLLIEDNVALVEGSLFPARFVHGPPRYQSGTLRLSLLLSVFFFLLCLVATRECGINMHFITADLRLCPFLR